MMKRTKRIILLLCLLMCFTFRISAQHQVRILVKSADDSKSMPGASATMPGLGKIVAADSTGLLIFDDIPAGTHMVNFTFAGFEDLQFPIIVPQPSGEVVVYLHKSEEHEEEVVVTATRLSRTIANIPTRVEVISGEELNEKANMKPGDIRMLLNESTGIQTQQTSATSFNAGIRIQGLEGRYTQLLRDGYPLYSGFAGGLSLLQIAPLDLKQVEVIKGAASTLYGGGAIAGLVNLVSKTPREEREISLLTNVTSAGGLDLSGFYSEKYGKVGLTLFASRNSNAPYDPADIGLTAIPKFKRYTINPRLFLYGKKTSADFGITYIGENRTGGSIDYIKNGNAGFFEKNTTGRVTTQVGIAHKLSGTTSLQFKNSYSRFNRLLSIPTHLFDAIQQSSFSEITFNKKGDRSDWVIGANFITEDLDEREQLDQPQRDYHYNTFGLFVQNAWNISENMVLESGLRADYINQFGLEILPRTSLLIRLTRNLTTRIGGGLGYKTPTIFTEEAERRYFQYLLPVNVNSASNERSIGGNWDFNYRTRIGKVDFSLNQLFYYTRLNRALILVPAAGGLYEFKNSAGHLDTRGTETNIRIVYNNFKLFFGYTFTDANTHFNTKEWMPLTARHRLNNVLMYELEDNLKLGLEAYYFGRQRLTDGTFGKPYWIMGFMSEKLWEKFSIFLNFENFLDARQSKFGPIYSGPIEDPVFNDIYAPVEGFVVNGGVKIKF